MSPQLKTIATFLAPEEADLARCILDSEGISSYLEGATTISMAWWWSNAIGGVKLQVAEADEPRARQILAQKAAPERGDATVLTCPHCGEEIPPGFEVCWSCQSPVKEEVSAPSVNASVMLTPQEQGLELEAETPNDENAARALRAGILGIIVCPPLLNFYSLWLLLKIAYQDQLLSDKGKRQYRWAMIINLIVGVFLGLFFAQIHLRFWW